MSKWNTDYKRVLRRRSSVEKRALIFCGEADLYGLSYFMCERILTNGPDEIGMHLTGLFSQVTG